MIHSEAFLNIIEALAKKLINSEKFKNSVIFIHKLYLAKNEP